MMFIAIDKKKQVWPKTYLNAKSKKACKKGNVWAGKDEDLAEHLKKKAIYLDVFFS